MHICRFFGGEVRFEAEGDGLGRLLTLAAKDNIAIWDTKRNGAVMSACCAARDYPRLRKPAKRCGLRLHIREKLGIAFVLRRYRARAGIVVGTLVFLALLFFFSGRIWSVELHGLVNANEPALRALLCENNLSVGAPIRAIDPTAIQLAALENLQDISWLSVNIHGCVATVEIKEPDQTEAPTESNAPSNLVAARDGIVRKVEITIGETTVQVGDAVAEGALLASGITETNKGVLIRRSAGTVLAETSREITVSVPLSETVLAPKGETYTETDLYFFGLTLPFSTRQSFDPPYRLEEFTRIWQPNGRSLPLGITMRRFIILSPQTVKRTEKQATDLAYQRLQAQEESLRKQVEILEQKTTQSIHGETLTLCARYRCLENIAREIPIQFSEVF